MMTAFGFGSGDMTSDVPDGDRRIFRRLPAKPGAMAFFDGVKAFGQIAEIGLGGLSFYDIKTSNIFHADLLFFGQGSLEIIYGQKDFSLANLGAQIVSDQVIKGLSPSGRKTATRLYRLQFKRLSVDQLFLLKRFLLTCTDCQQCYLW